MTQTCAFALPSTQAGSPLFCCLFWGFFPPQKLCRSDLRHEPTESGDSPDAEAIRADRRPHSET